MGMQCRSCKLGSALPWLFAGEAKERLATAQWAFELKVFLMCVKQALHH